MGVKNTLLDLNDHLFEQLERLNDEDLSNEELDKEIKRADAMKDIAKQIIDNANVVLKATELNLEFGDKEAPRMLTGDVKRDDTCIRIGEK